MDQDNSNSSALFSSILILDDQKNSTFFNNSIEIMVENWSNESNYINLTTELPNTTTSKISPMKEFDFLNPMWNVAFSAIVITGTLGNIIVLWIVLGE